jgi:hypothetical protein
MKSNTAVTVNKLLRQVHSKDPKLQEALKHKSLLIEQYHLNDSTKQPRILDNPKAHTHALKILTTQNKLKHTQKV